MQRPFIGSNNTLLILNFLNIMRKGILILFTAVFLFVGATDVYADNLGSAGTIVSGIAGQAGATTYSTPQELIGTGINAALTVVGLIFLILMIYAGYLWLTSHGEEEPIKKAQKIIVSSIIGFILVVSAYAITVFVGKRFEVGGGGTSGDACSQAHTGWSCKLLVDCELGGTTKEEMYAFCDEETSCAKDLCPGTGAKTQACCLGSGLDSGGGDPNLIGCCEVCEKAGVMNLSGCKYDSEPKYKWVSQAACNALGSSCEGDECEYEFYGSDDAKTEEQCAADVIHGEDWDCNDDYDEYCEENDDGVPG